LKNLIKTKISNMKKLSHILGSIEESTKVEKPKFINFRGMKDKELLLWLKTHALTNKSSKEDKKLWIIGKKISDKRGIKESTDITKDLLKTLSKIIEKTDDVYNTISLLDESLESDDARILIESLYKQAETLYEKVDIDHGIVPVELDVSWKMTIKTLNKLGFKEVKNPSKDIYTTPKGKILHLFGIPMRAGKWDDTFFVILDSEKKPYGIADNVGTLWYENLGEALKEIEERSKLPQIDLGLEDSDSIPDYDHSSTTKKIADIMVQVKELDKLNSKGSISPRSYQAKYDVYMKQIFQLIKQLDESSLEEVLNPNDEARVWIHDFVHSKNPIFDGKSKKKRIEMGLGAWYAAQKNEDVTHDEVIDNSIANEATDYTKFDEFQKQHKKMYPEATNEQIKSAWKPYLKYFSRKS